MNANVDSDGTGDRSSLPVLFLWEVGGGGAVVLVVGGVGGGWCDGRRSSRGPSFFFNFSNRLEAEFFPAVDMSCIVFQSTRRTCAHRWGG